MYQALTVLLLAAAAQAVPVLQAQQAITPLQASEIDAFSPFSRFAAAAYCLPSETLGWKCGPHCANSPGFIPVASGGDGDYVQYWYVGYAPSLDTVIVAHQGTNKTHVNAILTDLDMRKSPLNPDFFPAFPDTIQVHDGFRQEHEKTAKTILDNVNKVLVAHPARSITVVGHSLGGALAFLDAIFLQLHLPAKIPISAITYGLPRVGNKAFADYVDTHTRLTHINNKHDPIAISPGMFLDYVHPSGEIHILDAQRWVKCPGQDNPSPDCIVGAVPTLFSSVPPDHRGPYAGIYMNCANVPHS